MNMKMTAAWIIVAASMVLLAPQAAARQAGGCAAQNVAPITHPGIPSVTGLPNDSVVITGNINLVGLGNGVCPPPSSCKFIFNSTILVQVSPANTPVAGELSLTQGLGLIPIICGPAPAGMLAPTGVPGQYTASFNNVTLNAACGDYWEWTVRLWVDWGGLGGPLKIPVLTAILYCTGC